MRLDRHRRITSRIVSGNSPSDTLLTVWSWLKRRTLAPAYVQDSSVAPTVVGFEWSNSGRTEEEGPAGNGWCVRDAFCALFAWTPNSPEWNSFIEYPDGDDVDWLAHVMGIYYCDPGREPKTFSSVLDHPGMVAYHLAGLRQDHLVYAPHLRHIEPLGPEFQPFDPVRFRVYYAARMSPRPCAVCGPSSLSE